ncbi:hypothetical protein SHI21_03290 [Bacteriovorax sp. PP10]|uniref:Lipoprotein n=1 Tax=Bacteriovorax antarcticus TaxID=3088717 RepID=A0ABU5VT64_9BACT|nr:hypothetical protein [Bacteriovorax sp. PP10]MEA9355205.1 hypothetical protein [Bacteriovorax sp. PP10]
MRNLLLSLMVLASLVSCGKDKSSGAVGSSSSAITLNDQVAVQLGTIIDNSTNYFPTPSPTARYTFATTSPTTASNNCELKTGWLGIKYYYCSSSNNSSNNNSSYGTPILASGVDLAAKRNELKAYINSSYAGAIYNTGATYYIRTTSGVIYTIDTRYPIQVNPVSVQQVNGQVTYLYNVAY